MSLNCWKKEGVFGIVLLFGEREREKGVAWLGRDEDWGQKRRVWDWERG